MFQPCASWLHGHGYPSGKEQTAPRWERAFQFTRALRLFKGTRRIFFEAGFALNIIFSLVKGLIPSRAFVAVSYTHLTLPTILRV